jgi:hypothetical protein
MVRLILSFFARYFPEQLNKAYHTRNVQSWQSRAEFIFSVEGKSYYRFSRVEDIPLPRLEALQLLMLAMDNRLSTTELTQLAEGAIEKIETGMGGQKGAFSDAIFLIKEIIERKNVLHLHPEILIDIIATTCIREDEKLGKIDSAIHKAKMDVFNRNIDNIGFFLGNGLTEFLPKLSDYREALPEMIRLHQREIERRNTAMLGVIRGVSKSKRTG